MSAAAAPGVTVLMTVYDGLPYLSTAIESVLAQEFAEFEFLIIDDRSTDASVDCIRSYRDPRIRLVCNAENLGQARSLNRGLELARGEYVARLDQDDVALPQRLIRQVTFLRQHPEVAVVDGYGLKIDAAGRTTGAMIKPWHDYGTFLGLVVVGGCSLGHASVTYRRDAVLRLGGYDESMAPAEDHDLWGRLGLAGFRISVIREILAMYRFHETQQTATKVRLRQGKLKAAHERIVTALCDTPAARQAGAFLRLDPGFWDTVGSRTERREVLRTLDRMVQALERRFPLAPPERRSLRAVVYRWVGGGALRAILNGRRESWPFFLYALRGGIAMLRFPAVVLYPLFFVLSPFVTPRVGAYLVGAVETVRERRHAPWIALHRLGQAVRRRGRGGAPRPSTP